VLAPLTGKVALSHVQTGERVVEGQPIVRLISSDELFVKFAIPADKAGTLAPGSTVDVVFETAGIKTSAVVRHVAPELDPIAQMIVADADLVDAPAQLQSGMVCRIRPR
jgi:multidrug resistance efflux pump